MRENKLIEKNEKVPIGWIETDWAGSDIYKEITRELTEQEITEFKANDNITNEANVEQQNKSRRATYLDGAYERYCNHKNKYGESAEVEEWAERLRNKDWSAFDNIPKIIRYWNHEIGLAESGLI